MADTVVTTSQPWKAVRKPLRRAYRRLTNQLMAGPPSYYPQRTIAPMSGYTRGALNSLAARAKQGSGVLNAAQKNVQDTLSGKYLRGGNPAFEGAVAAATRPMIENYQNNVIPMMDSQFSAAGRYGSGAQALASSQAANDLNTQIGDVASQMRYQNYADERNNQIRGALMAPGLAQADYYDIEQLGRAGAGFDQYNQSKINAAIDRWNFKNNAKWDQTKDFIGLLQGQSGGTQVRSGDGGSDNGWGGIFTGALGGGLSGFSVGGPWGAVLGGLGGAAAGAPWDDWF